MVKPVHFTKYEASDGSLHETAEKAALHEARTHDLAAVMKSMPPVEQEDCEFSNGGGYKDWPINVVEAARQGIMRLLRAWRPSLFYDVVEPSLWYVGRNLSDGDTNPSLYAPFMRLFFCIDDAGREYGQPYYRNNPGECKRKVFE